MIGGCLAAETPALQTAVEVMQRHKDLWRQTEAQIEPGKAAATQGARAERAMPVGPGTARDPFAETELMLQGLGGFQGGDIAAGRMPNLRLRGLARNGRDGGVALLEIEGVGTFMLRPGETVTLRNEQSPLTLRLKRINAASIEVEAGQAQQVVVR